MSLLSSSLKIQAREILLRTLKGEGIQTEVNNTPDAWRSFFCSCLLPTPIKDVEDLSILYFKPMALGISRGVKKEGWNSVQIKVTTKKIIVSPVESYELQMECRKQP